VVLFVFWDFPLYLHPSFISVGIEGVELKGTAMQVNTNGTQEASLQMSFVAHESSQAIQISQDRQGFSHKETKEGSE